MKNSVKVAIAGGVLFVGGIVVGVGVTVVGMMCAFTAIGNSPTTPPPSELAEGIGYSLMATSIGMGVSFLGFCILIGGVIAYVAGRKRCNVPEDRDPRGPQSTGVTHP
jgi:hypothetical protein